MRKAPGSSVLLSLALLWGCSSTVLVPVPPRVDLKGYGMLGIVEFASNAERAINVRATRQFQEQIQAAQPGTRFVELGEREALLATTGGLQFDRAALRKIGERYGVSAVFLGEIVYSEPQMDIKLIDVAKLEGGVQARLQGEISSRLVETATGASIWNRSASVRRQIGSVRVSAEQGVSGAASRSNPRDEMLPALVYQLTGDFRPTTARQQVK